MVSVDEIANEISILLPKLMSGARGDFFSTTKITTSQMIVLASIYDHKRCTVSTLAKEINVRLPTITGLIDRLLKNGYVKRCRNPEDRREVIVELTKEGEGIVKKFLSTVRSRWKGILVHLNSEERLAYVKILRKLIAVLSGAL